MSPKHKIFACGALLKRFTSFLCYKHILVSKNTSESTNTGHVLAFATAADAAGSSEYTTGVTTSGTPGSASAYTQIVVASGAPDLFYYDTANAGMGAAATTGTTVPTSIKYKVKALNAEDYRLHGTSVMWATS